MTHDEIQIVRVLLVDDDEDDYILTAGLLEEVGGATSYDIEWRQTFDSALAAMCEARHDICLVDFRLGSRDGLDLLREAVTAGCDAPVILLTGQGDEEIDRAAMRAGAADYLVKGRIESALLARSIRYAVERARVTRLLRESEEQLRQAQKMEAVGRLAGGVAHDFNNLLTVITGRSALMLRNLPQGDPARRHVEEIKSAGERAATLTAQILAFSRKQMLQPKIISLNDVVSGTCPMLARLIGENIELLTTLDPALADVKADPGRLEQVLMNLAVNARDAMPDGGKLIIETRNVEVDGNYARLHCTQEDRARAGSYCMLAVSDTGHGMHAATQARVFEPFFTTKEQGKGTGLGLATVYGIVKQSEGHIWMYSEPDHGTTFKIYLPRVVGARHPRAEADAQAPAPARGLETILLVEDEASVRSMTREVLEASGYNVVEAGDGESALAACAQHSGRFHLLITDVVMPGIGGRELAERLVPTRPGMRVLFMSGYTDDAVVHHGVLNRGTDFIQKPFTIDAISHKVREVLDSTHDSSQPRRAVHLRAV